MSIVAAVDGEAGSTQVVETAVDLARAYDTELYVVNVITEEEMERRRDEREDYFIDDAARDAAGVARGVVADVTDEWYDNAGGQGGELKLRLHRVANRATGDAFEEFDERPAAVDAFPGEATSYSVGWWTLLHVIAGHQGYSPEETLAMFLRGTREACEDAVEVGSADEAVQRIDECIESLETLRADVEG